MAGSGDRVNYNIRAAKCIERKMMADAFRNITAFGSLNEYAYIGMGSRYFADFKLFHKDLGIAKMKSIESEIESQRRFEFNIPFTCVEFVPGRTTDVLPGEDLTNKTIIWLDYDESFKNFMLLDVQTIVSKISSGSALCITMNSSIEKLNGSRLKWCIEEFGDKLINKTELKESDLTPKVAHSYIRSMINNQITQILKDMNGVVADEAKKMCYQQIFNFRYSDSGAPMYTTGGVFYKKSEIGKLALCGFDKMEFFRPEDALFIIDVPHLTFKEVDYLNSLIPYQSIEELRGKKVDLHDIPETDIEKYKAIYRYYPHFSEVGLA